LVDGVALPRSAILIDTGGGAAAGGFSDSAIGIGAVRIDTNPGRNEDIAGVVTGVGGGTGGDIAGVGVRDGEVAREAEGFCMLGGRLLDVLARADIWIILWSCDE